MFKLLNIYSSQSDTLATRIHILFSIRYCYELRGKYVGTIRIWYSDLFKWQANDGLWLAWYYRFDVYFNVVLKCKLRHVNLSCFFFVVLDHKDGFLFVFCFVSHAIIYVKFAILKIKYKYINTYMLYIMLI